MADVSANKLFSGEQAKIAKALLAGDKSVEELRLETGISAGALNEGLRGLIKLRLVEKSKENKYKLIDVVLKGAGSRPSVEGNKMGKKPVNLKFFMIVEAGSDSREALEEQFKVIEERLRKEPYEFFKFEKSTVEELIPEEGSRAHGKGVERMFAQHLELEVGVPSFRDVVYLIISYGPSGIELLEPSELELKASDVQAALQ